VRRDRQGGREEHRTEDACDEDYDEFVVPPTTALAACRPDVTEAAVALSPCRVAESVRRGAERSAT